jgi:hypothetical protein
MKIVIQRIMGGGYWSHPGGWIQRRDAATEYASIVDAVDACLADRIPEADILITFDMDRHDVRLKHGPQHAECMRHVPLPDGPTAEAAGL